MDSITFEECEVDGIIKIIIITITIITIIITIIIMNKGNRRRKLFSNVNDKKKYFQLCHEIDAMTEYFFGIN